jgi:tetratricopeptide (TPR) repeat protein
MTIVVDGLQQKLQQGIQLHQAGQFAEAQAVYNDILVNEPRHIEAINLLGAIAIQTRSPEKAIHLFERAIELDPQNVTAYCNSGWALRELSQPGAALAMYDRALVLNADFPEVHFNRGNVLMELRQLDAALLSYKRAVFVDPEFAEAHVACGNVLQQLGHWTEALASYDQAIELDADYAEAHYGRGNTLALMKRFHDAIVSFDMAIVARPDYLNAHFNRGTALAHLRRFDTALESFDRAIELRPDYVEAYLSRASVLFELGRWEAALASVNRAIALRPDDAEAHCNRGVLLRMLNRPVEAEASLGTALGINPDSSAAIAGVALLRADRGRFEEAEELLKRAMALEPNSPRVCGEFVQLRKMTSADAAWLAQAQRIVAEQALSPRDEAFMRKAIGKYLDDTGAFDQAFAQFRRANQLVKSSSPRYEQDSSKRLIDFAVQTHGIAWLARHRVASVATVHPIFIVGMPRSGTTLAEQILASHPSVSGIGELDFWASALQAHRSALSHGGQGEAVPAAFATDYLTRLKELAADRRWTVDKTPVNFVNLGLILAALPNARIIHMQRNPIDTCLSMYFQNFTVGHPYSHDLEDLAHLYQQYRRVMRHWRETLPAGAMLEVPYESLVKDQALWSRKMVDFVGLAWDPRCLQFHSTDRTVLTASRWQVRQKVGTSSIERWRNYEKFVQPLLDLLD